jgi:hypothetical protein
VRQEPARRAALPSHCRRAPPAWRCDLHATLHAGRAPLGACACSLGLVVVCCALGSWYVGKLDVGVCFGPMRCMQHKIHHNLQACSLPAALRVYAPILLPPPPPSSAPRPTLVLDLDRTLIDCVTLREHSDSQPSFVYTDAAGMQAKVRVCVCGMLAAVHAIAIARTSSLHTLSTHATGLDATVPEPVPCSGGAAVRGGAVHSSGAAARRLRAEAH